MTERERYFVLTAVACVLSIGAIPIAVWLTGNAADGGRGGALAVALSFGVLFLNRNFGSRIYQALTTTAPIVEALKELNAAEPKRDTGKPPDQQITELAERIDALTTSITADSQGQIRQNKFLAVMSVVGTLAWGLGDLAAQCLMQMVH